MDWRRELEWIRSAGHEIAAGLSEPELAAAEALCACSFPPDLRGLLRTALPVGGRFPNWRDAEPNGLRDRLMAPMEGILFDIEQNAFWLDPWGPRPPDLATALERARAEIARAPVLIPVFGHRYLPAEPCRAGNSVLSVHQTDIISYGDDLQRFFALEFGGMAYENAVKARPSTRFWGDLAE